MFTICSQLPSPPTGKGTTYPTNSVLLPGTWWENRDLVTKPHKGKGGHEPFCGKQLCNHFIFYPQPDSKDLLPVKKFTFLPYSKNNNFWFEIWTVILHYWRTSALWPCGPIQGSMKCLHDKTDEDCFYLQIFRYFKSIPILFDFLPL